MTEKELKKLGKTELLELLVAGMKENDALRSELAAAREELQCRAISVQTSGTMAEAAMKLNAVFEAADQAAQQYLENIRGREAEGEKIIEAAKAEADRIVAEASGSALEMKEEARLSSEQYWKDITRRLEEFYRSREGLKEMLEALNR